MASNQVWYRFIGVRSTEAATVWLFFLHNFFLGIGTILVYVTANVILLENHPQTSLPIAYVTAAVTMMVVGRIYTYFEHHLILKRLAVRVLIAVVILTAVLGLLVLWGHSVASAVAIMAGYRMIYLLTNLEFWGVSAVVFDVRQGKRLFSIISSGDMPAKALGALLSVVVHAHADLFILLITAFVAFGVAMYVLRLTTQLHEVDVAPAPTRLHRRPPPPVVQQLFGGSELVFFMCLSLAAIACVVTSVEYFFFVNVKQKFHHQADLMQFVGFVLMLTYLSALVFKLALSWKTFERIGIRWSLAVLPVAGLLGILLFGILLESGVSETGLLIYFCGLYLLLEVLRRAVFDPIFLVLFQPLTPHTRLKGHTLVKGFYEPLGMALAGLLLITLHYLPTLPYWIPFTWMALFMGLAFYFLNRTYGHYLDTLKNALERRFLGNDDLLVPVAGHQVLLDNLQSTHTADVLNAIDWFQEHESSTLMTQSARLLQHPDSLVRDRTLQAVGQALDPSLLFTLATTDAEPALRQAAARWLARHPNADSDYLTNLLQHSDLAVQTGAIQGRLEVIPADVQARTQLASLATADDVAHQLATLNLLPFLTKAQQIDLVERALSSQDLPVQLAGIQASVQLPELAPNLIPLLTKPARWRTARQSLITTGSVAVPLLRSAVQPQASPLLVQRIVGVCEHIATPESRQLLIDIAEQPNLFWRAAALRALRNFAPVATDTPRFQRLLDEEWKLAQRLIQGIDSLTDVHLIDALTYELTLLQQRVFGLLMQLYDPVAIADTQRGVANAARDRKANALEMLDNLIPQPVYRSLQTLVDDLPIAEKVRLLLKLIGPLVDTEPVAVYIIRQGEPVFTDWTISMALRQITPTPALVRYLKPHRHSTKLLIRESVWTALQQLSDIDDDLATRTIQHGQDTTTMNHTQTAQISAVDRIFALKRAALFADTPENVLSSVAHIMNEVTYHEGQEIFVKGDIGTSLFILYDGEVGIFDGSEQLATFSKGGFFGELALLDTEPRSATAIALSDVLTFRIDQDDFYDLMDERGEVLQNIVRVLCQRLRRQNEVLRSLSAST